MSSGVTVMNFFRTSKPERTEEEKRIFQATKIAELKNKLSPDIAEIGQQLTTGGEFRRGESLDDVYFLRWLKARYWKVDQAAESIREHASWRIQFCPENGRIQPETIPNELQSEKLCLQGVDKKGRGCIVVRAARHSSLRRDAEEVKRFICYAIDRQMDIADVDRNPDRQTCVLFDLTDISVTALDVVAMHQVNIMLSRHFVERLGKLFIYNAPVIFWASWKTFSAILTAESLEKIEFVYPSDLTSLHKHIPLEILPEAFGGHGLYIPIHRYEEFSENKEDMRIT